MRHPYIDPVCGMRVETDKISAMHEGTRYVFCSAHCQQKFLAKPADYLKPTAVGSDTQPKRGCCG